MGLAEKIPLDSLAAYHATYDQRDHTTRYHRLTKNKMKHPLERRYASLYTIEEILRGKPQRG
ncbi:MAG: hypothetical protein LRS46_00210 [Desulfurococcales archaeon]|nr:hypothetical protein [Desulfurococcales archaeon]